MSRVPRAAAILLALLMAISILAITRRGRAQQPPGDRALQLDVVINGHPIGLIGEFTERAGKLHATRTELQALGLRLNKTPDTTAAATDVELSALQGVSYRVDERTQTLFLTAPMRALEPTQVNRQAVSLTDGLEPESGTGALVNYSIVGTRLAGHSLAEGLLDGRAFTPWGVVTSSGIATTGGSQAIAPFVRLDTTYSYADPDSLRVYRAGDFINGGLAWTRPVRLVGVQVSTDFSLRPDIVTFPVPTIAGQVAVPSSVDVLVNGVQLLSRDVPPGPFEVRQLPIVTGAGDVSVVVRNALGQDTTQTLPVYASRLLLSPGLSAFSAELGAVRLSYGALGDDYRAPAGSASYRYGMFDWLTLEGHGEASGSGSAYGTTTTAAGGMVGGGMAFTVTKLGVFSLDVAGSRFGRASGGLVSAGFERTTPVISLSGSVQVAGSGFGDIASVYGDPVPTLQTQGSVGFALGPFGSIGVAYAGVKRRQSTVLQARPISADVTLPSSFGLGLPSLVPATTVSLLSASYSRPVFGGRASLYATAYHDFATSTDTGFMVGLTIPLGERSSVTASVGQDSGGGGSGSGRYATVQANQSANTIGDFGWQAEASAGSQARQLLVGQYKSPWGLVEAGVDRIEGQTAYRATAQGSLSYVGGGLFAANTVYDSFAVVDTDTGGVQVLQENRPVGRTDSSGLMLVPDLRSFGANRLGIDPSDIPVDAEVGETTRLVRPRDHSGVVVHFPVRSSRGAIVKLFTAKGAPVPVGSVARLAGAGDGGDVAVGYDGETFLTGLAARNTVAVTLPGGGRCSAVFAYKAVPGALPEIGPVTCSEAAP